MKKSLRLIITAGPTREYLDPVRFLSNPSTGKMGFAVAQAAARRGHAVTLIAGPVHLKTPHGVTRVDVVSARDMLKAVMDCFGSQSEPRNDGSAPLVIASEATQSTFLISTAAIADWRPKVCAKQKLKKDRMTGTLELVRNPDILKTISLSKKFRGKVKLVGFAAETQDVMKEAARKCQAKQLEMIVANNVSEKGSGFGVDTNRVTFLYKDGRITALPLLRKAAVATKLVKAIEALT